MAVLRTENAMKMFPSLAEYCVYATTTATCMENTSLRRYLKGVTGADLEITVQTRIKICYTSGGNALGLHTKLILLLVEVVLFNGIKVTSWKIISRVQR